jgi:biotin transport system substrate-specific component
VTPVSRRLAARDLALVAVFAALIAAFGLFGAFYPFGTSVPVTAQTLGVMLAGSILGGRRGAIAVVVFLVLVAAGLPLLAGGRGGLGVFTGPSAGFLLGWVPGAYVIGQLVALWRRGFAVAWAMIANIAGGIVVIYACGVPVVAIVTDVSLLHALDASAVFLPGDVIKAVVAAVVASGVHRGYPVLLPGRPAARDDAPGNGAQPAERA